MDAVGEDDGAVVAILVSTGGGASTKNIRDEDITTVAGGGAAGDTVAEQTTTDIAKTTAEARCDITHRPLIPLKKSETCLSHCLLRLWFGLPSRDAATGNSISSTSD